MKVLFYCCEFAPEGKTGAIRPSKFAKYFLQQGVKVSVLTKQTGDITHESLLKDLSGVEVERVAIKRFLPINDDGFWFLVYSFFKLLKKARTEKFDYIFVSVPVFLPVIAVLITKYLTNTKYVIDYRDLWYCDPYTIKSFKDRVLRWIGKCVEPIIMKNASIVSFVSENMRSDQEKTFGIQKNATVISTGYDSEDLYNLHSEKVNFLDSSIRYYSHIGMLDWDMNVPELIELIKSVSNESKMKFLFVGGKNSLIKDEFRKYGIDDKCLFIEQVDKRTALAISYISEGLIILGSNSSQRLNRKVFESVVVNSNIFYYGCVSSPTAKVLKENSYRNIFDSQSEFQKVKRSFSKFCHCYNSRDLECLPSEITQYNKKNLTMKFLNRM